MEQKKFWLLSGNEKSGPYSKGQLLELLYSLEDKIWEEGTDEWRSIKDFPELSELVQDKPEDIDTLKDKNLWISGLSVLALLALIFMISFFNVRGKYKAYYEDYYEIRDKYFDLKLVHNKTQEKLLDVSSGKHIDIEGISFSINSGESYGESYGKSDLKRLSIKADLYSYLDESIKIEFRYVRKLPNGSWSKYGDSYYVREEFNIKPGYNTIEFTSNWGWDESGNWQLGNHTYTLYCDKAFGKFTKIFTVK